MLLLSVALIKIFIFGVIFVFFFLVLACIYVSMKAEILYSS